MNRRGDLTTALKQVSARPEPVPNQPAPPPTPTAEPLSGTSHQISRTGKVQISGYFDPVARKQLKQLALDHDSEVQALLGEALNDLFERYKLPRIA